MKRLVDRSVDVASVLLLLSALLVLFDESGYFGTRIAKWKQDRHTIKVAKEQSGQIRNLATSLGVTNGGRFVVEVGDYECPFCRMNQPTVDSALKSGVSVRFLHYPLQSHKFAVRAAMLTICSEQARNSEKMHSLLINSVDWSVPPDWDEIARAGGAPQSNELEQCLVSTKTIERIRQSVELVKSLGVHGTPTYIGPGGVVRGVASFAQLSEISESDVP